jgi:glutamate synthase (NADPH) small chain
MLTQPMGYEVSDAGRLIGLRMARTELGEPDDSGRRRPLVMPGTESILKVGLVIEALGQRVSESVRKALEGVPVTREGLIQTQRRGSFATTATGVFAAGDAVNGGTTAVQGVAEGMTAAAEIDRYVSHS